MIASPIRPRPRDYIVSAYSHGHEVEFRACWKGRMRIRAMAFDMFLRYFGGRQPSTLWGKDGVMAMAEDRQGNRVEVEQVNGRWDLVRVAPASPERLVRNPTCLSDGGAQ